MKPLLIRTLLFNLCIIYSCKTFAQGSYIDSLTKVLQTEKEDTNKVNTLDEICTYYWQLDNYVNTMRTAKAVLLLSTKIDYKIGVADGYLNTGLAYGINKDKINETNYFDTALNLYKATGNKQQVINCYGWMSAGYEHDGDLGKAIEAENAAQIIRQQTQDVQMIIDGYDRINGLYVLENNTSKAFECVYEAQKIREQTKDKKTIADGFFNIANTFANTSSKNLDEELKYDLSALKLYKELNDKNSVGIMFNMISDVYYHQGKYSEALNKCAQALQIFKDSGRLNAIASAYALIGRIYNAQGDSSYSNNIKLIAKKKYLLAEKNQLISLQEWKTIGWSLSIGNCYEEIGLLNIKLQNLKAAKNYLDSGMTVYQLNGLKGNLSDIYYGYAEIDSIQNNYKDAYKNYRLFKIYYDSANNEEDAKKTVQVQMQYEYDKKEAVTKAQQEKKDADAKRIKNQQYFTIAALAIIVLAVIVIALIQFKNNKQKQKANLLLQHQKEEIQHQKEKVETTLTELKSTQQQLIQSEKMASLGELTAGIAHEIQNPLNFVNNFSEVNNEMVNEAAEEINNGNYDEAKNILNDIKDNSQKINHHGKRADAIVKGMLQHSRQTKGIKEPTDINALCDEYIRLSYHGLRAKDKNFNADFKTDFDNGIGKINIVPQDIGRVLLNLFNNAFYAVNEKKKLMANSYQLIAEVKTRRINDTVEIRVSDNGNGIPQNIIDKVFQPFFTTKPTGEGTGLGLSLAYDIITKEHNGIIKVESKEGEGSVFTIQLPNS